MLVHFPEIPNVVVDLRSLPTSLSSLPSNTTILVSLFFALFLLLLVHATYILVREYFIRTKQKFERKISLVAQEQGAFKSSLKALETPSSPSSPSPSTLLTKCEKTTKVERVRVTASALEQQQVRMPTGKWNWTTQLFGWLKWDNTLPTSFTGARNDVMKSRGGNVSSGAGQEVPSMRMATTPLAMQAVPPQAPRLHRMQTWQQPRRAGPAFETPLPALYQTDAPASMAKIIMSRHTYRKPTLRPPSRSQSPASQVQMSRRPPSIV